MSLLRRIPGAVRRYATVSDVASVKVAAVETAPAATSSITVIAKAGSRYETKPGVAHVLKNFAFKSTSAGSALKTARETELYGGVLSASLSREHLFLTAEFLRGDENHFLSLLASVLSSTHYYPHEYAELVLPTVESEALSVSAADLALDVAHNVAFRRGLGNSLYASPHSPVSAADAKSYAQQAFAKSNIAVFGTGLSTDALAKAVQSSFGSGSGGSKLSAGSTTYYGGESRLPSDNGHSLVIAYGAGESTKELQVLAQLLGGESAVKWSAGSTPLSTAAAKVPGASARTFLFPYSDAALLGVAINAPTSAGVAAVAKEVAGVVKSMGSVKDDALKRAVTQARFADAAAFERSPSLLTSAASHIFSGNLPSPESFDKISASSIGKAAEQLLKGKPTVVAVGDLAVLPYADELGL